MAVKHGDPPPDGLKDQHVVIVDFSYKRDTIERLAKEVATLHILDHHVTAQEALDGLPYAHFDMTKSGAVLAWEWAHPEPVPWILRYVEDKDLWHWKLPVSREINAALASYPYKFEVWDTLRQEVLEVEGQGILRHENALVQKIVEEAVLIVFDGETVPAVYSPILTSQIGERLSQGHPFCIIWHQQNGRRYFSLRSQAGAMDVASLAKKYGGGGHRHAAGFSVTLATKDDSLLDPLSGLKQLRLPQHDPV